MSVLESSNLSILLGHISTLYYCGTLGSHRMILVHPCTLIEYYSCIGGCLVAQNTVAEIWYNAW